MKRLIVILGMVVMFVVSVSVSNVFAAGAICNGDFDCDNDVDGADAAKFKADFGRSSFNDPCPGCQALVPKTGQTTSYATGDDGDLEKGVPWPNPRFDTIFCTSSGRCINQGFDCDANASNDVVTDNLTGLMWSRDANLPGTYKTWDESLDYVDSLNIGGNICGYTDWRVPNYKELFSLVDAENYDPALPSGHPFTNVQSHLYWSSTTNAYETGGAWGVSMDIGKVDGHFKAYDGYYVWPVWGGQ